MALTFQSISVFRASVTRICKREKDRYQSCIKDIYELFKDHSFDEISQMGVELKAMGDVSVMKIRVPNSDQNLSASDGFRLIVLIQKKKETLTLLNIYPKRGKLGVLNQTKSEYKSQVIVFHNEIKDGSIKVHNLDEKLSEVEEKKKVEEKKSVRHG